MVDNNSAMSANDSRRRDRCSHVTRPVSARGGEWRRVWYNLPWDRLVIGSTKAVGMEIVQYKTNHSYLLFQFAAESGSANGLDCILLWCAVQEEQEENEKDVITDVNAISTSTRRRRVAGLHQPWRRRTRYHHHHWRRQQTSTSKWRRAENEEAAAEAQHRTTPGMKRWRRQTKWRQYNDSFSTVLHFAPTTLSAVAIVCGFEKCRKVYFQRIEWKFHYRIHYFDSTFSVTLIGD